MLRHALILCMAPAAVLFMLVAQSLISLRKCCNCIEKTVRVMKLLDVNQFPIQQSAHDNFSYKQTEFPAPRALQG